MTKNVVLNPEFGRIGWEGIKAKTEVMEGATTGVEALKDILWLQNVAELAAIGINTAKNADDKYTCVDTWEEATRLGFAIPSKRPGGGRSGGTGFMMPKTQKSYKHFMVAALDAEIELLDADGNPRRHADVKSDIEKAKSPKTPEEKLPGVLETYIKVRDNCAESDPMTVDADNRLINYMRSRGYVVSVVGAVAA